MAYLQPTFSLIANTPRKWTIKSVCYGCGRGCDIIPHIPRNLSLRFCVRLFILLINGLKGSSFMSPELKEMINANTWYILGGGVLVFTILMTAASAMKLPVLRFVVLLGTFALAMAFAGNDLVNFVGVPLTGLEAYQDYVANGSGTPDTFLMQSLMESAHTPTIFLILAGVVMVLSLVFSKKAQNVVKTSVDLSRQDEGDEMFGSPHAKRNEQVCRGR